MLVIDSYKTKNSIMDPLLNIAINAARNAGKIIVRFIDHLDMIEISEKSRNDVVTNVDKLAEKEIIQTIQRAHPEHAILAEESGQIAGNEFCWIIDPLDGTTNYAHGFPHYAVSIALKDHQHILIGVIYDPIRQELFTATKGGGAQLNNRRIRVSNQNKLDRALIGTGFPFRDIDNFKNYLNIFATIFPQSRGVRRAGSAALDLAYVAAGRLDGFWESALKEWDIAAGAILIKEAGGIISDYDGENDYLTKGNVITGNPKIYKALFNIIHPG